MSSVLRQVEYYFSDHSWPSDEFLKGLAAEEGKDGFVDLSVIAGFGKMKTIHPSGSVEDIAAALADSDSVQLSADKTGAKRLYPLPTEDPALGRTVHVAQFDTDESRAGLSALLSAHGAVEQVRCLRNLAADDRAFDGTALVVFADEAGAAAACAAGEKGDVLGTAGPAAVKMYAQHYEDFEKKRAGMKKKRSGDEGDEGGSKKKRKTAEAPVFDEAFPKGLVLSAGELGATGCDREAIKAACEGFGPVGWVEYQIGEAAALVRFNEGPHAAAAAAAGLTLSVTPAAKEDAVEGADAPEPTKVEVAPAALSVLSGDEERGYWLRKHEDTIKRNQRGKGGKGGRGGRGGGKGRKGGKGRR